MHDLSSSETAYRITSSLLKAIPQFPRNAVHELQAAATIRRYQLGELIIEEGQPTGGIFLLLKGAVQRWMSIPTSRWISLPNISAPAVLGVGSCMLGEPSALSASAAEPSEAVFIPQANVLNVLRQFPNAGLAISGLVSEELAHTYAYLTELRSRTDTAPLFHLVN